MRTSYATTTQIANLAGFSQQPLISLVKYHFVLLKKAQRQAMDQQLDEELVEKMR